MADPTRVRIVDEEISLVPYYPNDETALPWYQDPDVCRQVDNIDHVYTSERLNAMYKYLSTHGACYYISYRGVLVGDVSLRNSGELAIVICREYQNRHIGRRCKGHGARDGEHLFVQHAEPEHVPLARLPGDRQGVVRARALNAAFLDKRCALCYAVIRRCRRFPPHKERRIP